MKYIRPRSFCRIRFFVFPNRQLFNNIDLPAAVQEQIVPICLSNAYGNIVFLRGVRVLIS